VYSVTGAHQSATLSADVEGNTPLHLVCQANGDRPDLIKAVLGAGSAAARRTNKDGKLPLHVLTANFAHDDNLEALEQLLAAFPEGAEVADDFGCLPVDLLPRETKAAGGAERFITSLVEAIDVDISVAAHDLVRQSLLPAPAPGRRDKDDEDAGSEAVVQADRKLLRLAARCDVAEEDHEAERKASQLDSADLMAGLRRQRLPVGHEHVSSQFWSQRWELSRQSLAAEDEEQQAAMESSSQPMVAGMQTWHPHARPSSAYQQRSRGEVEDKAASHLENANRRMRMTKAAAKHPPHWGNTSTDMPEPQDADLADEEAVYLISGKKRVITTQRNEELSMLQLSTANPSRRSRSRSRGRSRTRASAAAPAADARPQLAPQRGRRAPASVKAAGMLSGFTGRDSVSQLLEQEHLLQQAQSLQEEQLLPQAHLGRLHVAALEKKENGKHARDTQHAQESDAQDGAHERAPVGGKMRQSVTSSSRTRSRRHSVETPSSRSYMTLEDFKGGRTPLPLTASASAAASKRVSMASGTSMMSRASGASERSAVMPHRSRTLSPAMYSKDGNRGSVTQAGSMHNIQHAYAQHTYAQHTYAPACVHACVHVCLCVCMSRTGCPARSPP